MKNSATTTSLSKNTDTVSYDSRRFMVLFCPKRKHSQSGLKYSRAEWRVSPEHLRDGEHEGIVEYDAQGPGQKVRTELPRQRPEQEETRALLLLQLPQELSLVWQSASECCT